MRLFKNILTLALLLYLAGCDPVHDLKLENQSNESIKVIYSPYTEDQLINGKEPESMMLGNKEMSMIILDSGETMKIGTVTARYTPGATDVDLEYLEVRYKQDTIRLKGKNAILSTIQEVEKLDWRLVIK